MSLSSPSAISGRCISSYYIRTRSYAPSTSQSIQQVVVESTKSYIPGRQFISDTERPFLFAALYVFPKGRSVRFLVPIFIHVGRQATIAHLSSRMLLQDGAYGRLHRVERNWCSADRFSLREIETTSAEIPVRAKTTLVMMSGTKKGEE